MYYIDWENTGLKRFLPAFHLAMALAMVILTLLIIQQDLLRPPPTPLNQLRRLTLDQFEERWFNEDAKGPAQFFLWSDHVHYNPDPLVWRLRNYYDVKGYSESQLLNPHQPITLWVDSYNNVYQLAQAGNKIFSWRELQKAWQSQRQAGLVVAIVSGLFAIFFTFSGYGEIHQERLGQRYRWFRKLWRMDVEQDTKARTPVPTTRHKRKKSPKTHGKNKKKR